MLGAYVEKIIGDVKLARPMKIVMDCGNGVAGAIAPELFKRLCCEIVPLFCEVDGNFPNHHPDPSKPENLADVIKALKETDAEIGIAFDGDGDRLGVVTKDGEIIYPDRQLMLFAADVLSRVPGDDVGFARALHQQQNLTILPGSYLARDSAAGNPGRGRVRISLVASVEECVEAAQRIRRFLTTP